MESQDQQTAVQQEPSPSALDPIKVLEEAQVEAQKAGVLPQSQDTAQQDQSAQPNVQEGNIFQDIGEKAQKALGEAPSAEAPSAEAPSTEAQSAEAKSTEGTETKPTVKEVYHFIHPEMVKHTTEYKNTKLQAEAIDELASVIKEQLALAHEGKPIKTLKEITQEGKPIFTEEHMPTGEDIVELQRQYTIATTVKSQIDQHLNSLEQSAAQSYQLVDKILKAADEHIFNKVDFSKGAIKNSYDRLTSAVPKHIQEIPIFASYLKLLALNEAMAQALVTKSQYNSINQRARQHAGPGTMEKPPADDEIKNLDRAYARILGIGF